MVHEMVHKITIVKYIAGVTGPKLSIYPEQKEMETYFLLFFIALSSRIELAITFAFLCVNGPLLNCYNAT